MTAIGSPLYKIEVTGRQGPRGLASGPLGAGSVGADEISDDAGEQEAIADKIGAVKKTATGGIIVSDPVGEGLRPDSMIRIDGLGGDKALLGFTIDDASSEAAITAYFSGGTLDGKQLVSLFCSLVTANTGATSFIPYWGVHGECGSAQHPTSTDNTPLIVKMNNTVVFCAENTGGLPWNFDEGPDLIHNYKFSYLQGATVIGLHTKTVQSGYILQTNGLAHFGTTSGGGEGVSTEGVTVGWSAGGTTSVIQSKDSSSGVLKNLELSAALFTFAGGNISFDNDNARSVGTSSKRASVIYAGTGTINTSDENEKTIWDARKQIEAERRWAARIAASFVGYQFNEAIAEKGDGARVHYGVIAQEIERMGIEEGIADPFRYAFLCRDQRVKVVQRIVKEPVQKVKKKTVKQDRVEMIDGVATLVSVEVETEEKLFKTHKLFTPDGQPVMGHVSAKDLDDPKKTVLVQATYQAPVMIEKSEKVNFDEPEFEADGVTPKWIYGIRYTPLFAFLFARGAVVIKGE